MKLHHLSLIPIFLLSASSSADGETPTTSEPSLTAPKYEAPEETGYASFFLGMATPTGLSGYGTRLAYGADVGFRLSSKSTLGVQVSTSESDYGLGDGLSIRLTPIVAFVNFMPAGHGLYFGPRIGMIIESGSVNAPFGGTFHASEEEFTVGAQVGYLARLQSNLSTGVEVSYNRTFGPDDGSYGLFQFLVPIRMHF